MLRALIRNVKVLTAQVASLFEKFEFRCSPGIRPKLSIASPPREGSFLFAILGFDFG